MLKRFFLGIIKYTALFISLMLVGALSTFLTMHFFTSGDEISVPDLKGKSSIEAIQALQQVGLSLKIAPQKRSSDTVPSDRIVAQEPQAAVKIKRGRSIVVYLSLGPEQVIVPDVVGQSARVASVSLEQRGLHQGKIIYVHSFGADGDQVLAQFPAAGVVTGGDRTVNLLVSNGINNGKAYVMPDVIGKSISDVKTFFQDAGLRVGALTPVHYPGIPPGTIVKQMPPAGYKIAQDGSIALTYSELSGASASTIPQQPEVQSNDHD